MTADQRQQLHDLLQPIYHDRTAELVSDITQAVADFTTSCPPETKAQLAARQRLTPADQALICYANSVEDSGGRKPLAALRETLQQQGIFDVLPIVHLLPFYPWDTDRGFSVQDYRQVHPEYGTWDDIAALDEDARLMFDFVANHASVDNPLIQSALIATALPEADSRYPEHARYKDFAITFSEETPPADDDLAQLSRPRPNPVLTPYFVEETGSGELAAKLGQTSEATGTVLGSGYVWTTFSRALRDDGTEDTRQVDLNFKNPQVFLEAIKILLFYVQQGAEIIRLDAIGYIWKKLGSASLHEPEAHAVMAATNFVLTGAAPGVLSIAEVNEPQEKVFTYLGSTERPESDLVYQFTHFPLAVMAVHTGSGAHWRAWLPTTEPFAGRQFITALGSHDGMGMKPIIGLVPDEEIDAFTKKLVAEYGALPNYAKLPGGKEIVYEAAATPWNLINQPDSDEPFELQLKRYLAVLALGLIPRGIPALYINGLIGATNYQPPTGLDENRTINRQVFDFEQLSHQLADASDHHHAVLAAVKELLARRASEPAFDPAGSFTVLDTGNDAVIAVRLFTADQSDQLLSLVNVSAGEQLAVLDGSSLTLAPYQVLWQPGS